MPSTRSSRASVSNLSVNRTADMMRKMSFVFVEERPDLNCSGDEEENEGHTGRKTRSSKDSSLALKGRGQDKQKTPLPKVSEAKSKLPKPFKLPEKSGTARELELNKSAPDSSLDTDREMSLVLKKHGQEMQKRNIPKASEAKDKMVKPFKLPVKSVLAKKQSTENAHSSLDTDQEMSLVLKKHGQEMQKKNIPRASEAKDKLVKPFKLPAKKGVTKKHLAEAQHSSLDTDHEMSLVLKQRGQEMQKKNIPKASEARGKMVKPFKLPTKSSRLRKRSAYSDFENDEDESKKSSSDSDSEVDSKTPKRNWRRRKTGNNTTEPQNKRLSFVKDLVDAIVSSPELEQAPPTDFGSQKSGRPLLRTNVHRTSFLSSQASQASLSSQSSVQSNIYSQTKAPAESDPVVTSAVCETSSETKEKQDQLPRAFSSSEDEDEQQRQTRSSKRDKELPAASGRSLLRGNGQIPSSEHSSQTSLSRSPIQKNTIYSQTRAPESDTAVGQTAPKKKEKQYNPREISSSEEEEDEPQRQRRSRPSSAKRDKEPVPASVGEKSGRDLRSIGGNGQRLSTILSFQASSSLSQASVLQTNKSSQNGVSDSDPTVTSAAGEAVSETKENEDHVSRAFSSNEEEEDEHQRQSSRRSSSKRDEEHPLASVSEKSGRPIHTSNAKMSSAVLSFRASLSQLSAQDNIQSEKRTSLPPAVTSFAAAAPKSIGKRKTLPRVFSSSDSEDETHHLSSRRAKKTRKSLQKSQEREASHREEASSRKRQSRPVEKEKPTKRRRRRSPSWNQDHPFMKMAGAESIYNHKLISKDDFTEAYRKYAPAGTKLTGDEKKALFDNLNSYVEETFDSLCDNSPLWFGVWTYKNYIAKLSQDGLLPESMEKNPYEFVSLLKSTVGVEATRAAVGVIIPKPGGSDTMNFFN